MTVKELIKHLEELNPEATVWISDQQGGGGLCNSPWEVEEPYDFYSGEIAQPGDVVVCYENT